MSRIHRSCLCILSDRILSFLQLWHLRLLAASRHQTFLALGNVGMDHSHADRRQNPIQSNQVSHRVKVHTRDEAIKYEGIFRIFC